MPRDLSVRLGSLHLPNPLIAASGCFGYGLEYEEVADLASLGGVCVKGLFMTEREGHAPPRIVETPAGMINAIGLQGIGVHRFVKEKLPLLRERGARVFVNVCGTTIDEYVEVTKVLTRCRWRGRHRAQHLVSEHQGRRHPVRVQPGWHERGGGGRAQGHPPAGDSEAHPQRHRRRLVRPRGRGCGRRRGVAREHVPGDGDRRGNAAADDHERARRPQRSGDSADRRYGWCGNAPAR